jgi:ABC-type amino acid transport system permease subunit
MIIWSGLGFFVAVIVLGCALAANLIADAMTGSGTYWDENRWTLGVALLVAAVLCWFVGRYLRGRKARTLIDKQTGEEVIMKPSHSLFFIPMDYWGPILAVVGLALLVKDLVS